MKTPPAGAVLLAVTCVWGSTFVVTKDLIASAPPFLYLVLRFGLAGILLAPFLHARWRTTRSPCFWRDALLLGALNACGLVFQVFGQVYTSPAKSSFLTSLGTPLTALVGLLLYRAIPTPPQRVAMALASLGLVLLTWPPAGSSLNLGDLLTIGCAIVYAVFIVEAARRAPRQDPMALAVVLVLLSALVYIACCCACHVAMKSWPASEWPAILRLEARPFPRGPRAAVELGYMAVVCVAIVMPVQTWALQRLSATTAAIIFAIEPVVATGLAVAFRGASEWPGPRGATGGFLVLCAVYVAEGRSLRRRRKSAQRPSIHTGASDEEPGPLNEQPPDFGPQ